GASKVFLVTDPGVRRSGWTSAVEESLNQAGVPYVVFDGITPNPKDYEVMEGGDLCREEGCDLIVAVGGGSPMDCAKGIGVVVGNPAGILEFEGVDMVPEPGPPLIFVPTTAGSAADVSQFAIITDSVRKVKIAIISKMVIPDIALIDPATTTTMTRELTAATGMDALSHAFEAFVSTASSPLTDMAALNAVGLIIDNLPQACAFPEQMIFREKMMTASLMAGLAFSNASLGLVHAMAHSLGGALGLAHGQCNALLLEKVAAFNYPASPEKYDRLAGAVNRKSHDWPREQRGSLLADSLAAFRKNLGIDQQLSALGVTLDDIPGLAEHAFDDPCLATNPTQADIESIAALYRELL
ncbi:MAG: iron-containing alcohol dehydrogenase, partial [Desulfobacteraceae bacterium]